MDIEGFIRLAVSLVIAIIAIFVMDWRDRSRTRSILRGVVVATIKTGIGIVVGLALAYVLVDWQAKEADYRWTHDWIDDFFLKSIIFSALIVLYCFVVSLVLAIVRAKNRDSDS